ncbi:MAG: DUF3800 domain-containing protein [Mesorhizobium sp.]|uniref:DUF3800 domain-containing protein n=1 Tax=Mesorhizobium sp. TaxID=1871066 RepID=UPI00120F79AE|nr:DUF3800 domain-containing protein [Mesorhizobium sp.]TIT18717.1 MAG: DUF3800 domain-containing protein [Mesorhizobium sp.]
MVLRYVYLDESGTHDRSPALAMAGYVFEKEQAQRFSRDWNKDLKRFGLPFAHMTDCATGNGHYEGLSLEDRIKSEKALIAHTRHRSSFGVAVAVDYIRYKELFGRGRYDHDAYTFCLMGCVIAVHYWAQAAGYRGRFAYVFEAGHAAQSEANVVMKGIRGSRFGDSYFSHTFVDKEDAPPLQAADMLAWQYAHHLKRRGEGFEEKRKDFVALMRPGDQLQEVAEGAVDQWRVLMNELDQDILKKLREDNPDISENDIAWAAAQMKQRS